MEQNNTNKEEEIIELRSEKTRRFVGDIPRRLQRMGIVVIIISFVMFAMFVFLMRYNGEPLWKLLFLPVGWISYFLKPLCNWVGKCFIARIRIMSRWFACKTDFRMQKVLYIWKSERTMGETNAIGAKSRSFIFSTDLKNSRRAHFYG